MQGIGRTGHVGIAIDLMPRSHVGAGMARTKPLDGGTLIGSGTSIPLPMPVGARKERLDGGTSLVWLSMSVPAGKKKPRMERTSRGFSRSVSEGSSAEPSCNASGQVQHTGRPVKAYPFQSNSCTAMLGRSIDVMVSVLPTRVPSSRLGFPGQRQLSRLVC